MPDRELSIEDIRRREKLKERMPRICIYANFDKLPEGDSVSNYNGSVPMGMYGQAVFKEVIMTKDFKYPEGWYSSPYAAVGLVDGEDYHSPDAKKLPGERAEAAESDPSFSPTEDEIDELDKEAIDPFGGLTREEAELLDLEQNELREGREAEDKAEADAKADIAKDIEGAEGAEGAEGTEGTESAEGTEGNLSDMFDSKE